METSNQKAIGKFFLLGLSLVFLLAQIIFAVKVAEYGNGDMAGEIGLSLFILVWIILYYQGYNWAKWILSVSLILLSLAVFTAGMENESTLLKLTAIFYLYFGVIPHFSKYLQSLTQKEASAIDQQPTTTPVIQGAFTANDGVYEYPLLLKRYQSMLIDAWLILFVAIILFAINDENQTGKMIIQGLLLLAILAYEPLLTAYSTTIGQKLMGIRVRDIQNPSKRISIANAYIRFFTKAVLGWISFISIHFNPEHRAIHDMAGSSVVIKVKK